MLAGSIVGALIAFGILIFMCLYLRRRHISDHRKICEGEDDYWETRFRELEAEAESPGEKGERAGHEIKRLRVGLRFRCSADMKLTLDLASKALPNRPASRLSTISGFFKYSRPESQLSTISSWLRPASVPFQAPIKGKRLNFSRPLRASLASTRSKASAKSSRFGTVSTPQEERKGMEWIRGDEGERDVPLDRDQSRIISDVGMIVPTSILRGDSSSSIPTTFGRKTPQADHAVRFQSPPSPRPDVRHRPASSVSESASSSLSETSVAATFGSIVSSSERRLFPPERRDSTVSSLRDRRGSQGRAVPELHLSREALTPSLWIDEDVYARFQSQDNGVYGGIEVGQVLRRAERSAVTPQLPVVQVEESPSGMGWGSEAEERMVSVYQRQE